jgi:hypothetical protein
VAAVNCPALQYARFGALHAAIPPLQSHLREFDRHDRQIFVGKILVNRGSETERVFFCALQRFISATMWRSRRSSLASS